MCDGHLTSTGWKEEGDTSSKIAALRKIYQRAVLVPLDGLDDLWRVSPSCVLALALLWGFRVSKPSVPVRDCVIAPRTDALTLNLDQSYEAWEKGLNEHMARQTLPALQPGYLQAKTVARDRRSLLDQQRLLTKYV